MVIVTLKSIKTGPVGPIAIVVVAIIIGYWYLKRHTDIFGGATLSEVSTTAAQQRAKEQANKIASVGGGSRRSDIEKVKIY